MRLIKLYNLKDEQPIYINVEQIGHIYEVDDKWEYGKIETPKHSVVGVTTHNNGGFKVLETTKQIIKLMGESKGI